jgi:hypothetical protein
VHHHSAFALARACWLAGASGGDRRAEPVTAEPAGASFRRVGEGHEQVHGGCATGQRVTLTLRDLAASLRSCEYV